MSELVLMGLCVLLAFVCLFLEAARSNAVKEKHKFAVSLQARIKELLILQEKYNLATKISEEELEAILELSHSYVARTGGYSRRYRDRRGK